LCLLHFGSEGETSDGGEMCHPWLGILKVDGGEEAVKVVDGKKGCESREGVVSVHSEHPLHGFSVSTLERRVGLEASG